MHTPEGMGAGGRREGVWAGPCTCLRSGIRWGWRNKVCSNAGLCASLHTDMIYPRWELEEMPPASTPSPPPHTHL